MSEAKKRAANELRKQLATVERDAKQLREAIRILDPGSQPELPLETRGTTAATPPPRRRHAGRGTATPNVAPPRRHLHGGNAGRNKAGAWIKARLRELGEVEVDTLAALAMENGPPGYDRIRGAKRFRLRVVKHRLRSVLRFWVQEGSVVRNGEKFALASIRRSQGDGQVVKSQAVKRTFTFA